MLRSALALVGLMIALANPSAVWAATSPEIIPDTASPGESVTFLNGCLGVVDDAPAEVKVAFVEGDEVPENPSTWKANGQLTDPFTYEIVVPDIVTGDYVVYLECLPGDWSTNRSEPGGGAPLQVLGGGPDDVSCEDVGTCVVFDPQAASPGSVVTVIADPSLDSSWIPIADVCPPEGGQLTLALEVSNRLVYSPLSGTDQRATFVIPNVPPGEYLAFTWCLDVNSGFAVGTFTVLGMPNTATAVASEPGGPGVGGIVVVALAALVAGVLAVLRARPAR